MIARRRVDHHPVTSILYGDGNTATVHFHCPCGTTAQQTITGVDIHPPLRYTAALRQAHTNGAWPPAVPLDDLVTLQEAGIARPDAEPAA